MQKSENLRTKCLNKGDIISKVELRDYVDFGVGTSRILTHRLWVEVLLRIKTGDWHHSNGVNPFPLFFKSFIRFRVDDRSLISFIWRTQPIKVERLPKVRIDIERILNVYWTLY